MPNYSQATKPVSCPQAGGGEGTMEGRNHPAEHPHPPQIKKVSAEVFLSPFSGLPGAAASPGEPGDTVSGGRNGATWLLKLPHLTSLRKGSHCAFTFKQSL